MFRAIKRVFNRLKLRYIDHKVMYNSNPFYEEARKRNRMKFIVGMVEDFTTRGGTVVPTFDEIDGAFQICSEMYSQLRMNGCTDEYGRVDIKKVEQL